jgi:hypothetical protein
MHNHSERFSTCLRQITASSMEGTLRTWRRPVLTPQVINPAWGFHQKIHNCIWASAHRPSFFFQLKSLTCSSTLGKRNLASSYLGHPATRILGKGIRSAAVHVWIRPNMWAPTDVACQAVLKLHLPRVYIQDFPSPPLSMHPEVAITRIVYR